jgi:hypothetical protein
MEDVQEFILGIAAALAKSRTLPVVYPGYIASGIRKALKAGGALDPECLLTSVGELETIGDCRYAIPLTDFNGTKYRVIVEVAKS